MHIAIYHCSIKIISRGGGKSSVAAAAYRAGENITSEYDGRVNDYTRKSGIVHTEILLPDNAPPEYKDRAVLWNAVEKIEKAKNSQLAREIQIALPREFSEVKNRSLVREYVKKNFVDKGMCADIAIHDKNDGNPHAHILLTMRPFNADKSWGAKQRKVYIYDENGEKIYDKNKRTYKCNKEQTTDWNDQTKAEEWRSAWANITNKYLERSNIETRVDHRSFKRQGKDEIPTIHLGTVAHQLEKRGIKTERGNINREIEITNQRLRQLKARIRKMQNWVNEEMANDKPPTLAEVIQNILAPPEISDNYFAISKLKSAANVLNFLTENNIQDVAELDGKFSEMNNQLSEIQQKFKPIDRRLKVLETHLEQSDNYKVFRKEKVQYEKLYAEYKTLKKAGGFGSKRKIEKAFETANDYHDMNRDEITIYETAEKYLREVLQERFDIKKLPPITKWKAEFEKLTAEKTTLNGEYIKLKSEVDEISKIRNSVYGILGKERKQTQPQKTKSTRSSPATAKSATPPHEKESLKDRMARAQKRADENNASRPAPPIRKKSYDRDR